MINRTKTLVLALFAFYWAAVVAILLAAPPVPNFHGHPLGR